jgi:hypothetical protein
LARPHSKGDWFLVWIAVLGYEVASVAGKGNVIYLTFATLTQSYHLPDVGKMIASILSTILTSNFRLIYYLSKVFPFVIPKQQL